MNTRGAAATARVVVGGHRVSGALAAIGLPLETRTWQKGHSYVEFPFSRAQAEAYREEFMAERVKAEVAEEDVYEQQI